MRDFLGRDIDCLRFFRGKAEFSSGNCRPPRIFRLQSHLPPTNRTKTTAAPARTVFVVVHAVLSLTINNKTQGTAGTAFDLKESRSRGARRSKQKRFKPKARARCGKAKRRELCLCVSENNTGKSLRFCVRMSQCESKINKIRSRLLSKSPSRGFTKRSAKLISVALKSLHQNWIITDPLILALSRKTIRG
nr:uncharacterized protein LOC123003329 [Drosophila takahashii]